MDAEVRSLCQALEAAVGHHVMACQLTSSAEQLMLHAFTAVANGSATLQQSELAATSASRADSFAASLSMFEPKALSLLLQLTAPRGVDADRALTDLHLAARDFSAGTEKSFWQCFLQRSHKHHNKHSTRRQLRKRADRAAVKASAAAAAGGSAAAQEPAQLHQPNVPVDKGVQVGEHSKASNSSDQSSSSTTGLHPGPGMHLSPDDALDLLLCQPGGGAVRRLWRKVLAGTSGPAVYGKPALEFLCVVYHLPAACDVILAALVCDGGSQLCKPGPDTRSSELAAGRVQLLRAYAVEYVEGLRHGKPEYQDIATAKVVLSI